MKNWFRFQSAGFRILGSEFRVQGLWLFVFSFFIFCLITSDVNAQFIACTDSAHPAQPTYSCPADYNPVCGCNGITYRNQCVAQYQNGLNDWADGICGSLDIYFTPNYIVEDLNFYYYVKESGLIYVLIYDPLGNIKLADVVQAYEGPFAPSYQLNTSFLDKGVYIISFSKDGQSVVKKFLKTARN